MRTARTTHTITPAARNSNGGEQNMKKYIRPYMEIHLFDETIGTSPVTSSGPNKIPQYAANNLTTYMFGTGVDSTINTDVRHALEFKTE